MYIKNKLDNSCIKVYSSFELSYKLKDLCFEIAYFSYAHRSTDEYVERISRYKEDHQTIFFAICSISSDTPIGCTAFFRIDWVGRMEEN